MIDGLVGWLVGCIAFVKLSNTIEIKYVFGLLEVLRIVLRIALNVLVAVCQRRGMRR